MNWGHTIVEQLRAKPHPLDVYQNREELESDLYLRTRLEASLRSSTHVHIEGGPVLDAIGDKLQGTRLFRDVRLPFHRLLLQTQVEGIGGWHQMTYQLGGVDMNVRRVAFLLERTGPKDGPAFATDDWFRVFFFEEIDKVWRPHPIVGLVRQGGEPARDGLTDCDAETVQAARHCGENAFVLLGPRALVSKKEPGVPDPMEAVQRNVHQYLSFVHLVLVLVTQKQVRLERHDPPERLQRKRRKRGRVPRFSFHTLSIRSTRGDRKTPEWTGLSEVANRFHLCRGHFKLYTEDAPLLGKHVGLFWWEPHFRGSIEAGAVDKDYELEGNR